MAGGDPGLYYETREGSGPYLLLVHGFLSSRAQWRPNLEALAACTRPVVVELWGHGRSPSPEGAHLYTPAGYVAAFERIRQDLRVDRWFICGQSLGAALTLRYALDHAERIVAQVFTNSNSALAEEGWAERVRPGVEAQARRLEAEGRRAIEEHPLNPARGSRLPVALRDEFARDAALHDPRGLAMTGLHTVPDSSVRSRIAGNRVPALLVAGGREERFAEHRRYAQETMPLLSVLALNGGHAINIDAPAEFNDAVVSFFTSHLAGAAQGERSHT